MIALLALFGVAGAFGTSFNHSSHQLIGYATYILPFILIFLGVRIFGQDPEEPEIGRTVFIGSILFLATLASLMHIFISHADAQSVASGGGGGGYVGYWGSAALLKFLSPIAGSVILLALLLIAALLTTGTGFRDAWGWLRHRGGEDEEPEVVINEPQVGLPPAQRVKQEEKKSEGALTSSLSSDEDWQSPPLTLLEAASTRADAGNIRGNAAIIQKTLADFGIVVEMQDVNVGPTVAQYTFKPAQGVKLEKITTLQRNISLALAADPIRIEAPIPGKSSVGIEVPNRKAAIVRLKDLLESPEFQNKNSKLSLAIGRDVSGSAVVADLERMPHLLIAGSTGSGKSVGMNAMLLSLLYQNSPRELRLILVDPKRGVELGFYNDIPHLLTPVIATPEKTISALKWCVAEMERRYQVFAEEGKRNIAEYNRGSESLMPFIVIVVDELATLMQVSASEAEGLIVRLAQMARATGIHLIVATQRPSVDVVTGLIKANITSRIAFAVGSQVDSRTILDMAGAEKLLGSGDMLYLAGDVSKPRRIQGPMISEKELLGVARYLKEQEAPEYNAEILKMPAKVDVGGHGAIDDDLFEEATELAIRSGKISASLLQRRLRVGYARAARLLDLMEERGVIGPADGAKPREVLITDLGDVLDVDPGQAPTEEHDEY